MTKQNYKEDGFGGSDRGDFLTISGAIDDSAAGKIDPRVTECLDAFFANVDKGGSYTDQS